MAAAEANVRLVAAYETKTPTFRRCYESRKVFRYAQYQRRRIAETSFSNFMAGQQITFQMMLTATRTGGKCVPIRAGPVRYFSRCAFCSGLARRIGKSGVNFVLQTVWRSCSNGTTQH
jgi:hypothetical protein